MKKMISLISDDNSVADTTVANTNNKFQKDMKGVFTMNAKNETLNKMARVALAISLVLAIVTVCFPTLLHATCGVELYGKDGKYYSVSKLKYTAANNAEQTSEILKGSDYAASASIFNNWPSNESGDGNILTHYLYSPEDFYSFLPEYDSPEYTPALIQPLASKGDGKPLGDRIPIILVHGWQGEKDIASPEVQRRNDLTAENYWENFIKFFNKYHYLRDRFKIYVYKYPSYKHVTFNARILRNMLTIPVNVIPELQHHFDAGKKAIFIGHSMGTLVIRSAFEEHDLPVSYAEKIILLDGVHHGSPAAVPGWVILNTKLKDLYTLGANDIQWDNYDGIFTHRVEGDKDEVSQFSKRIFTDITNHPSNGIISELKKININKGDFNLLGYFYGPSSGITPDGGITIRLNETLQFDDYFRKRIVEEKAKGAMLPIFKKFSEYDYFIGKYSQSVEMINVGEITAILPIIPNPWLVHLNLKHQTMILKYPEYKKKIILYAGVNANGEYSINTCNNSITENKNNHLSEHWDNAKMGCAEDTVQYLGDDYGYLNDGPVPLNSQLMDMKYSYGDLTGKSESGVVGLYTKWIYDGHCAGNSTVKTYTPLTDGYDGDGSTTHILFMDYHHDRMLNGGYYDIGKSLLSSHPHCSNMVMFGPLGYEARTGFNEQTVRMSYVKNSLNAEWSPEINQLFLQDKSFGSTCESWEINVLKYEPLFLSIAYQLDSKWLIDRLKTKPIVPPQQCVFSDIIGFPYESAIIGLCSDGIIKGYDGGLFKPEKNITRAEFIKIVVEAKYTSNDFDNYKETIPYFVDVANHWARKYIEFAKSQNIIDGYNKSKSFMPEKDINKVEAAKIIANVFRPQIFGTENNWANFCSDVTLSEWYSKYVNLLIYEGIMGCDSANKFYPGNSAKRGEIAEALYKAKP